MHFPEQPLDWESLLTSLLTEFARSTSCFINELLFQVQMHFLFMCGMSVRVESLAFKLWRDYVIHMINTASMPLDHTFFKFVELVKVYAMTKGNRGLIIKIFCILLFFIVFMKLY
jgi:ABC-type multidrug transport system permease subunit